MNENLGLYIGSWRTSADKVRYHDFNYHDCNAVLIGCEVVGTSASKDEGQYHGFVVGAPVTTPYDGECGTDNREVVQNTETHGALKRQGLPADELKPAWKSVLDAARGFTRQLDTYVGKDGHLTGKQKQDARNTVGKVVDDIIGGKT